MKTLKKIVRNFVVPVAFGAAVLFGGPSCNFADMQNCDSWYKIDDSSVPRDIDTAEEIDNFVYSQIRYEKDSKNNKRKEYWQLPQETLSKGKGDCEDRALLGLALYYKRRDNVGSLEIGELNGTGHAEANYHGNTPYEENQFRKSFEKKLTIEWENIKAACYAKRNLVE